MNIAGRPPNANKTRLNKMVQKKSKSVKLVPLTSHTDNSLLFVGNESATALKSKKTASVKFPSFSHDVALGLLQQYSRDNPSESGDHTKTFPQIKGARCPGNKTHNGRSKCNSLSLESQGKTIFTEGLSSISRRNEPSLVFHRRDIHGSNIPETVKVARERSKVVFSVRGSEIQNKAYSNSHRQLATGITASMTSSSLPNSKNENHPLHESPISKVIKKMELKYGISPCVSPHPDTPGVIPVSEDNYMSNYSTPRRTPQRSVQKGSVNVVSLTPDFTSKKQRSPHVHVSSTDDKYNQREAFRQHKYEQRPNLTQMPCDIIREERIALRMTAQEVKTGNHNKLFKRYKCEPPLSHEPFGRTCANNGSLVADKSVLYMKNTDGSFHVRGIFGASISRQDIWIPGHMPEDETELNNPPPSTESTYLEDLISNIHETKMMTPLQEEASSIAKDKSPSLVDSSHPSGPATPIKRVTHLFEVQPIESRNSNHSGKSSNFLTVPIRDTKIESRPMGDSPTSMDEDIVSDTEAGVPQAMSTQTDQPHFGGTEIKPAVQTLELFLSDSPDMPSINLNDSSSSPDPIKRVKKFEPILDATDLDYVKDYATGRKSQESVHNKAIQFMSPLEVEENAKRQ